MLRHDTGVLERVPSRTPEIEPILAFHALEPSPHLSGAVTVPLECLNELPAHVIAARPDTRPDGGDEVARPTAESRLQGTNGTVCNMARRSPPTGVPGGGGASNRIGNQQWHTISRLHNQSDRRIVGRDDVGFRPFFHRQDRVASSDGQHVLAVHLTYPYQRLRLDADVTGKCGPAILIRRPQAKRATRKAVTYHASERLTLKDAAERRCIDPDEASAWLWFQGQP